MNCFLKYGALISPLASSLEELEIALDANKTGVHQILDAGFNKESWFLSKLPPTLSGNYDELLKLALKDLLNVWDKSLIQSPRTGIIVSSTKGNLELLAENPFKSTNQIIQEIFEKTEAPILISNACISGLVAINVAADYIKSGKYDRAVIIGIDVLSDFVVYGFQSLFALSPEPCQPYDKDRKGINLGEACGIILMTNQMEEDVIAEYVSGSSSNDANHISGPSRTGEGLVRSIQTTLERAKISTNDINHISAHGTATIFNDEMESIAFDRLGLSNIPTNSLKGYFGHTLGASGVIEMLVCLLEMKKNTVYKSLGYKQQGTSQQMNIAKENKSLAIDTLLKTASGFGGGNASILIRKVG